MEQGIKGRTVYHMNGKSLAEWLELKGALSPQQAFSWLEPAVRQLAREHEEGRVHGSITPEAVMVYERLWYCFSLSEKRRKCFAHDNGESREGWCRLTEDQNRRDDDSAGVSGSSWEALEIKLGREETGPWSDVYSICAVIYTAITGRPPESAAEQVNGTELRTPSRLGIRIDEGREAALMKGLALLKKDRWQNGEELYQALYGSVKKPDPKPEPEPEPERVRGFGGKKWIAAAGGAVLAAVLGISVLLSGTGETAVPSSSAEETAAGTTEARIRDDRESETAETESQPVMENVLMADSVPVVEEKSEILGTGIACEDVVTVTFLDSLADRPEEYWDVSADSSGRVLAWAEADGDGYDLYIGAEGGVSANPDSSMLFANCVNLRQINMLEHFDTSRVTDMSSMFEECNALETLDVSSFDTSQVTNMYSMFYNCGSLTELDVSGFDTSQVTDLCGTFSGCGSLTELDVSGFDTSQTVTMFGTFFGCGSLTELDVSGFDTSQVTDMRGMFTNCSNLTELDVSGFDTSQVTSMYYMFLRCSSLTEIDVSNFDTSQVTDMDTMFGECSSLTSLDVSGFDTSQVTTMRCMFYGCGSLTELDLSSFDTSQVTNMEGMFFECGSLASLDVSSFDTSRVTTMLRMFYNCGSLAELDISGFDMTNVEDDTEMLAGTRWGE